MKRAIFFVLCLMIFLPLTILAQIPPNNEIRVFKDGNYSGFSSNISSNQASLVASGWNDMISSIRLGSGISRVVVYEHTKYGGQSKTITKNTDFSGSWWNDKTSSLQILTLPPANEIRVYKDGNYSGSYSNMSSNQSNLSASGWNDMISSIEIGAGVGRLIVYEHTNYGGQSRTITANTDLSGSSWNDKISSFRIFLK